jgi:hypothetical protein
LKRLLTPAVHPASSCSQAWGGCWVVLLWFVPLPVFVISFPPPVVVCTHKPPYEQLLVGVVVGAVSSRVVRGVAGVVAVPVILGVLRFVPSSSSPFAFGPLHIPPTIHPTRSCSWGWVRVVSLGGPGPGFWLGVWGWVSRDVAQRWGCVPAYVTLMVSPGVLPCS